MGYYIETPGRNFDKAEYLQSLHDAKPSNGVWSDVQEGQTLVCVVSNGLFEAAGIIYDEREYRVWTAVDDLRPKTWLLLSTETAKSLCDDYADFKS